MTLRRVVLKTMLEKTFLVNKKDMWCLETMLASIATWWNRNYEMIFIDTWDFSFEENNFGLLGERIKKKRDWNLIENFEKYHGIKVDCFSFDGSKDICEKINQELNIGKPFPISFNSRYAPWAPEKEKLKDFANLYIIVGESENKSGYYLRDLHLQLCSIVKDLQIISKENLVKGCTAYLNFTKLEDKTEEFDLEKLFLDIVNHCYNVDMFKSIRSFADCFESALDFNKEVLNFVDWTTVPLIRNIETISRSRSLFSISLGYLGKKNNISKLISLSKEFMYVSSEWNSIKSMLVKYSFTKKFDEKMRRVFADTIRDISKFEELFAQTLTSHNLIQNKKDLDVKEYGDCNIPKFIFLNLEAYFNNSGIGSMISNECTSDLTGLGEYFYSEGLSICEILNIDKMSFKLPEISDGKYDNISCNSQKIAVIEDIYSSIMIMACSEYGDFLSYATLEFNDGKNKKMLLSVSNWWNDNSIFDDEVIAWSGKKIEKNENGVQVENKSYNIFAQNYLITENRVLSNIILPNCSHIHIFAITLKK